MGHGEQGTGGAGGDADRQAVKPRISAPKQGRWVAAQLALLILNAVIAGLSWRDHSGLRASVAFAGVIVSSICLGNLLSTSLWIGLVDEMLGMGRGQIEMLDRLLKDRDEPRS